MELELKPLEAQVLVITGATSGIGLVTARMAHREGAKLVLAARNESALDQITREIVQGGGEAVYVVADVANELDLERVARTAIERFGCFDTWVNNAGVSIYGKLLDLSMEDQRRLFETNFWGVVHGCRAAVPHLRKKGGALINVGSVLSERSIPLQGIYCASKHAVKGYTEALRRELAKEGAPISVTLIKPAAVDTPYKDHAKNYLDVKPRNPPPVYAPHVVAEAILHCAQHPKRDVVVGGGGKMLTLLERFAPSLADKYMGALLFQQQRTDQPAPGESSNSLYSPASDLRERGDYSGHVAESSVYTKAALHPAKALLIAAGCGLLLTQAMRWKRDDRGA